MISGKIQRDFAKSIHFFHIEGKKTVLGWLSWLRAVLLFCDELAMAWRSGYGAEADYLRGVRAYQVAGG